MVVMVAASLLMGCVEEPEGAEPETGEAMSSLQMEEQALSTPTATPPLPTSAQVPELTQPWELPQYAHLKPADEVLASMVPGARSAAPTAKPEHLQKQNDFFVAWNKEATALRKAGVTQEALEVERALFKEKFFAGLSE